MLTKLIIIDKIEIVESGHIQIRERTDVIEDGKVLSKSNHRYVIDPPEAKKQTVEIGGYRITVEKAK